MHLFGEEDFFCLSPGRDVPLNALVVDKAGMLFSSRKITYINVLIVGVYIPVSTTECTSFRSRLTPIQSWENYVMNSTAVQGQVEYLLLKAVSSFRELPESTDTYGLYFAIILLGMKAFYKIYKSCMSCNIWHYYRVGSSMWCHCARD